MVSRLHPDGRVPVTTSPANSPTHHSVTVTLWWVGWASAQALRFLALGGWRSWLLVGERSMSSARERPVDQHVAHGSPLDDDHTAADGSPIDQVRVRRVRTAPLPRPLDRETHHPVFPSL